MLMSAREIGDVRGILLIGETLNEQFRGQSFLNPRRDTLFRIERKGRGGDALYSKRVIRLNRKRTNVDTLSCSRRVKEQNEGGDDRASRRPVQ